MTYTQFFNKLTTSLKKHNVEYMIIGGGGAILQGFNMTTSDVDIYPEDTIENCENLIDALTELNFDLSPKDLKEIRQGKDFIQFNSPFELDIAFYPDGFDNYNQALKFKTEIDSIPVMQIEGIIKSKKSANRPKDKLIIPLMKDFAMFLCSKEKIKESTNYYDIPYGYVYADNQTLYRWQLNKDRSVNEKMDRGIR